MPPTHPAVSVWRTARAVLSIDRPFLIGILNVTPDSFSDGGRYGTVEQALAQAEALLAAGADLLDIGGESTRPGRTEEVTAEVERARVVPAIEAIVRRFPQALLSIDTAKADVARAALAAGAAVVNDVTAFRHDPSLAGVVASTGAGVMLMHSRGRLLDVAAYTHASYPTGVAPAVIEELGGAMQVAREAGIASDAVVIDPGFGFAKTVAQNFELLETLETLTALGRPMLVGPSRKRFLGEVTGLPVEQRDGVTAVACALAYERGARLFRVHDVATARAALAVAAAVPRSSRIETSRR